MLFVDKPTLPTIILSTRNPRSRVPSRLVDIAVMNRQVLSPWSPYLVLDEVEADGSGAQIATKTVFLTASTCPIGCHMCDLHHHTLPDATPPGAIPQQIRNATADRPSSDPTPRGWIKLYNSGNFFDPRSIRPSDYRSIASLCKKFQRVIVENHPRFGADRLLQFRDLLDGQLEVAVGLETVQPRWLDRLGKKMTRDDFDRYGKWLRSERVDLRVFLIAGVPGVDVDESIRWTRLSARHAIRCGARHISLIPARRGNGWNGHPGKLPEFSVDDLAALQVMVIRDADGAAVVTVDLWDVAPSTLGRDRIEATNRTQRVATA